MPPVMPGLSIELADRPRREAGIGEEDLHVRGRGFLQHLDRGADQRGGVGQQALAGEDIAHQLADKRQAARFLVGGRGAADLGGDAGEEMVLQILADPGQRVHHRHADAAEMVGVADARSIAAHAASRSRRRRGSPRAPPRPARPCRRARTRPRSRACRRTVTRRTSASVTTARFGRFMRRRADRCAPRSAGAGRAGSAAPSRYCRRRRAADG